MTEDSQNRCLTSTILMNSSSFKKYNAPIKNAHGVAHQFREKPFKEEIMTNSKIPQTSVDICKYLFDVLVATKKIK